MTPDDARTLQLGEPVRFTRQLRRRALHRRESAAGGSDPGREWRAERWPGDKGEAPREGIALGCRTLADGAVSYDYETGTTFYPERRFPAVLVAFDRRCSPVYVLPEHLERVVVAKLGPGTDTVTIPRPTVPHGPVHLTVDESDAIYFREAARTLEARRAFGSNLTRTIAVMLDDVAAQLEQRVTTTDAPLDIRP